MEDLPVRCFAIAVRTDPVESVTFHKAKELLEFLPQHPIAKRLKFVDPLDPELRSLAV